MTALILIKVILLLLSKDDKLNGKNKSRTDCICNGFTCLQEADRKAKQAAKA